MTIGIGAGSPPTTGPLTIGAGVGAPITTDAPATTPAPEGGAPGLGQDTGVKASSALDLGTPVNLDHVDVDSHLGGETQSWLLPAAPDNGNAGDGDELSPWTNYKHKKKGSSEPPSYDHKEPTAPNAPTFPPVTNTTPVPSGPPAPPAQANHPTTPKPPSKPAPSKPTSKPTGGSKPAKPHVAKPKPTHKPEKHVPAKGRKFATQGDPIIKTGDGLQYSINKPGKYTSLKSESGDFLMQQQVSKTKDNRDYNTAIGFKVGDDKIAFDTHGGNQPATLKVNGKAVKLGFSPLSMKLPHGGTLKYDPATNKIHIHTPQGDDLTVQRTKNPHGTDYLNVDVEMSAKRPAGSVYGVLGTMDADGSAKNDAKMRDGKTYGGAIGSLWKTPEKFVDEWRSKPSEDIL